MNRKKIFWLVFVFMFLPVSLWLGAQESRNNPVAVSPGSDTEAAAVWQSCPTFSWSAVNQAASYRVEVFELANPKVDTYENMAALSSPVLSKDIPGPALTFTLSSEESLKTGSMYAWYVQALDASGNIIGQWSNGRIFKVEQEIRFLGIEEKLGEILRGYGVSEEVITHALKDMQSGVKEIVVRDAGSTASSKDSPGTGLIQGYEGDSNTYFGKFAGAHNTAESSTFLGYAAGISNTTGCGNTFVGIYAGYFNLTGYQNTFLGKYSGLWNVYGYSNTFLGHLSGGNNSIGNENTFLGDRAGFSNTGGYSNTFVGMSAGYSNTLGLRNLFLGYKAGYNETESDKLYIANSDTSSPLIYGEFDNSILTINGKLGIGTKTPGYPMELVTTGINAAITARRTDGATNFMNSTASYAQFGAVSNHAVRILVNSTWKMSVNTDGSLSMANGATCTSGGVWTNASSRDLKENIECLSSDEAVDALHNLSPVKYNYKADKADHHVGFIAEDVPELVATADRKGMSPMDVVAVLTRVVQEQEKIISDLQERMAKIENEK